MRRIAAILVVIILAQMVSSLQTIIVQEGELVNLVPSAYDPDNEPLTYNFSAPLQPNGSWQTSYGDVGSYNVTVTVSDGKTTAANTILLIVEKKEEPPAIESFSPAETLAMDEGNTQKFEVKASDLNKDPLQYSWLVDGIQQSTGPGFSYRPDFFDAGMHTISVIVSDGRLADEQDWEVTVNKVDRTKLLDNITDIMATEGETVRLPLPDFRKYDLEYAISAPIGNDGIWETSYADAGMYKVSIEVKDKTFEYAKTISVNVSNDDRAPVLASIPSVSLKENQLVTIKLKADDPDNDTIIYSAENLPAGASFQNGIFSWQTNYDTVKKDSFVNRVLDKFHLLSKTFTVTFVSASNGLEARQEAKISVEDVNRPPMLANIDQITVKEGEILRIDLKVFDADGDVIGYSCHWELDGCKYQTTYDDEGVYNVKVVATDDFSEVTKDVIVTIINTNRVPTIAVSNHTVMEGNSLKFTIDAKDPDGDSVNISINNLPQNASFDGHIFSWTPSLTFTNGDTLLALNVSATDNINTTFTTGFIAVKNDNILPVIINATPIKEFTTYVGNPIQFDIVAEDADKDTLTYTWKFGIFEKYVTTNSIIRTFTSPGTKDISVVVADDEAAVTQTWKVNVVSYDDYIKLLK